MSHLQLDPSHIIQVGAGFRQSKTVPSAVELQLFTHLGADSMTGEEIGERLGLHPWRCATRGYIDSGAISPRHCRAASRKTR
jgi:hypothetical protein